MGPELVQEVLPKLGGGRIKAVSQLWGMCRKVYANIMSKEELLIHIPIDRYHGNDWKYNRYRLG